MENPKAIGFRIWYEDGSVYESSGHLKEQFEFAPEGGVQVIVLYKEGGYRAFLSGGDWYYWTGDEGNPIQYVPTPATWGTWAPPPEDVEMELIKRGTESDRFSDFLEAARASKWLS